MAVRVEDASCECRWVAWGSLQALARCGTVTGDAMLAQLSTNPWTTGPGCPLSTRPSVANPGFLQEAVRVLSRTHGASWLMAHAYRLMDGGGVGWREQMRGPLPGAASDLTQEEAYTLRYARSMLASQGGWRTALGYLRWCARR